MQKHKERNYNLCIENIWFLLWHSWWENERKNYVQLYWKKWPMETERGGSAKLIYNIEKQREL